ncbi:MAG TPA: hypothetical protein VGI60_05075 [Chthoniobacterales bacterium]
MKTKPATIFFLGLLCAVFADALLIGTIRDPNFWRTSDQRGDALCRAKKFSQAAKTYTDPLRVGTAQYRNGDFEAAAKTFARVPGAFGAFDQGNAWLMHGAYDAAIASYDRALAFRHDWKEAKENKALAIARKEKIAASGGNAAEEQTGEEKPDEVVFDLKGENKRGQAQELAEGEPQSDAALQATWLRRVQTTPGDFLRAKFYYQAAMKEAHP